MAEDLARPVGQTGRDDQGGAGVKTQAIETLKYFWRRLLVGRGYL
jgi:hypothetical protein